MQAVLEARYDGATPAGLRVGGARDRLLTGCLGSLAICRRGAQGAWHRVRLARSPATRRTAEDDLAAYLDTLGRLEAGLRDAIAWREV
jgi:hypothetical protein